MKWEFPGGKVNVGESLEECLRRELAEELGIQAMIGRALIPATYQYPMFTITLYPFICSIESGDLVLHEHVEANWLPPAELHTLDWAEEDIPIVNAYKKEVNGITT